MRTDKPDIHSTFIEKYYGNQPVIIAFYVEHITVIAHGIHATERIPYITEICPARFLDNLIPTVQRRLSGWMPIYEAIDERFGNDYHSTKVSKFYILKFILNYEIFVSDW